MKRVWIAVVSVAALLLLAAAVYFFVLQRDPLPEPEVVPPATVSVAPKDVPPPPAADPVIKHPIEAAAQPAATPEPFDLQTALIGLFGSKTVQSLFQLEDFPRRLVATVDNLGRTQATPRLWPLNPVGGKFLTLTQGTNESVSPDNGMRYTLYVLLLERVNLDQAVMLYKQIYPVLQHEYEQLGYPRGYFNDRLVEVIDLLLATPEPNEPLRVHLPPPPDGATPPARPWLLYEFDNPALQSLSAGQRVLLRMGPVNTRRVKARLIKIRQLIARMEAPAK